MKEHFRGVVWPKPLDPVSGLHRYLVVGLLVTNQSLPEIDTGEQRSGVPSTAYLDGAASGMSDALNSIKQPKLDDEYWHLLRGDATQVLLNLRDFPTFSGPEGKGE